MSNRTEFTVSRAEFQSHCLPKTKEFIELNLSFFHQSVAELASALDHEGPMLFVSNEEQWSFAAKVDHTELGKIVEASGALIEGGRSKFDEVIADLHSKP